MSVVHRIDLDRLKLDQRDWIDLLGVCRLLKIGKLRAKRLVQEKVLRPVAGPVIDGSSVWRFRRVDIDALEPVLFSGADQLENASLATARGTKSDTP